MKRIFKVDFTTFKFLDSSVLINTDKVHDVGGDGEEDVDEHEFVLDVDRRGETVDDTDVVDEDDRLVEDDEFDDVLLLCVVVAGVDVELVNVGADDFDLLRGDFTAVSVKSRSSQPYPYVIHVSNASKQ